MKSNRSLIARVGAVALVLAAAGTASVVQARSNVYFSVSGAVAPGVVVSASNAPYYYGSQPVYYQPAPVYYEPAPVYYAPASYYVQSAPVYYSRPYYYGRAYYRSGHRHRYYR